MLRFVETTVFTRQITELLDDSDYAELQAALALRPDLGDLIPGTGGLRKVRWSHAGRGRGKRGGARVIYYWHQPGEAVYLLAAYSKGQRDDLTTREKKLLRRLVEEEFR